MGEGLSRKNSTMATEEDEADSDEDAQKKF
jgi:hypothetical protein